jgi:hypothetical protein
LGVEIRKQATAQSGIPAASAALVVASQRVADAAEALERAAWWEQFLGEAKEEALARWRNLSKAKYQALWDRTLGVTDPAERRRAEDCVEVEHRSHRLQAVFDQYMAIFRDWVDAGISKLKAEAALQRAEADLAAAREALDQATTRFKNSPLKARYREATGTESGWMPAS